MRPSEREQRIRPEVIRVTQVRSAAGISPRQRDTLRSLKLGRIGKTSVRTDSPELRGMLNKVGHLVEVKEGK